jgi:Recombination endonuclease VII
MDAAKADHMCAQAGPRATMPDSRNYGQSQSLPARPPHLESPESRKKSKRKYRISCYGLTQDDFDLLLKIQGYACGMCRELFAEGQLIHVDHDHECCRVKNRSCGKCVRGLLCHACNIALGHIEHRYTMARAYLDGPRPWAALRA